jgi:DeoR/GlpR family transcriptional regulator of sugar metabolism
VLAIVVVPAALSFFAPITAIDVLVTDDGADPQVVTPLRERGLEVHVAPVAP